jgi:hypothetical protein
VSDGRGGTASATVTVTVDKNVHVQSIAMSVAYSNKNQVATAAVSVHNQNGTAVASATVTGNWYFKGALISSGVRATTNSSGQATLTSPSRKAVTGDLFMFRVTGITATGYRYAPEFNHATEGSIAAR